MMGFLLMSPESHFSKGIKLIKTLEIRLIWRNILDLKTQGDKVTALGKGFETIGSQFSRGFLKNAL